MSDSAVKTAAKHGYTSRVLRQNKAHQRCRIKFWKNTVLMTNSRGVPDAGINWKFATLLTNSNTAPYDREIGKSQSC